MALFDRQIAVDIETSAGAVKIHGDSHVKFAIRNAIGDAISGDVTISNLARETMERIEEAGGKITVMAGYGEDLKQAATGDILRVEHERHGLDRLTKIAIGPVQEDPEVGISNVSRAGEAPVRDLAAQAIADLGLAEGDMTALDGLTVTDFSYAGRSRRMLEQLLRPRKIEFYEEDGAMHFSRELNRGPAARNYAVNANTGMIGTPALTDKGARVKIMLNAAIKLGDMIDLNSELISGEFKVIGLLHNADNRYDEFATEIDMARPEEA